MSYEYGYLQVMVSHDFYLLTLTKNVNLTNNDFS